MQNETKRCDTISCKAPATHRFSWPGWDGGTVHESVCEPCGNSYMSRAQFRDMAELKPLDA
ncbi:hypothetical protein [Streptomyces formicae]|uniref:GATA-type domain-containing protein n=1 Tax=Streptomyces formicae TaxID=1616117 RepID=A0ABY3WIB7_9ACTN|nr:hypothetical protein [Streptomyces formicae]UNM12344.1 hypothetical protein J4032_13065 [Streptomyces formicae]